MSAVDYPASSSECVLEAQRQQSSSDSSFQLPNVFVTPPEEEYNAPPWCCFDADRDAQPGAFIHDDTENQDFDYAAHAEDEIFGGGMAYRPAESSEKEDVFVMRSLMQEAENLKEKLKSLDLSAGSFSFTAPLLVEDEEVLGESGLEDVPITTTTTSASVQTDEQVKRRKSIFAFRPLSRRKSCEDNASEIPFPSKSANNSEVPASNDVDMDIVSIRTASSRKSSFFSRFKRTSKKSALDGNLDTRKSTNARRLDELPSSTQEQEAQLRRRFSFFGRRPSFSSPRTITTTTDSAVPSIMASTNQSTSSLSTSSIPPTPDVGTCNLGSAGPLSAESSGSKITAVDATILSPMDALAIDDLAASLTLPSSQSMVSGGQFSLDPLHFESLQFDSDDFP